MQNWLCLNELIFNGFFLHSHTQQVQKKNISESQLPSPKHNHIFKFNSQSSKNKIKKPQSQIHKHYNL